MAKTALEKLNDETKRAKIVKSLPKGVTWGPAGSSMAIAAPTDVDALMKKVRKGKLTTTEQLRNTLAKHYGTDITCPITTGIFINLSAAAAQESKAQGRKRITPYWRTLKTGGELNPKFPGGVLAQRKLLQAEGFAVEKKGKHKLVVSNYERYVVTPELS